MGAHVCVCMCMCWLPSAPFACACVGCPQLHSSDCKFALLPMCVRVRVGCICLLLAYGLLQVPTHCDVHMHTGHNTRLPNSNTPCPFVTCGCSFAGTALEVKAHMRFVLACVQSVGPSCVCVCVCVSVSVYVSTSLSTSLSLPLSGFASITAPYPFSSQSQQLHQLSQRAGAAGIGW